MKFVAILSFAFFLTGCGSLDKKALLVNSGDSKELVTSVMGVPDDRQFKGDNEAWQYCQTGAGFGYHDYRVIWFYKGLVSGINSYKSSRTASSCVADIKQINWEDAPDVRVEVRNR
ncbi:hypothetical protein TUM4438_45200 [Shewanella sairae]|uniref:Lipoprotein n=1 Tax=Shewanella sairae TaxID=190310 RepID=A0ABQ4PRZ0_9GAMM|nr:hypothetical protein [Shewanella sairae]MCL1132643.1 hypothetical protein [Shewanella sairae]GIU52446.1 hypothetical protein TUM4438_45200 [Shewanella sairae]